MAIEPDVLEQLRQASPGGVRLNVPLAQISRWRIGGPADVIIEPSSIAELQSVRSIIARNALSSVVIGDTSNLLFADDGLRTVCIQIARRLQRLEISEEHLTVEAGFWVPLLARRVMQLGLTGAEHVCGIPGTVGGLICMNGGSQRKSIGSAVRLVTAVGGNGELLTLDQRDCGFGYRASVFQDNQAIVASAVLQFTRSQNRKQVHSEMLAILRERSRKFPRKQPNCGSVFKSSPAMYNEIGPPGAIIERLGLKGKRIGDALVSPHHANFMVNVGHAKATDMLRLIAEVSDAVFLATGYRMEAEARFVTPDGRMVPVDDKELLRAQN